MPSPEDEIKQLAKRFGMNGLKDMMEIDQKVEILLHRMLIVTTIAHNLYVIDDNNGEQFLETMHPMIASIQEELAKSVEGFTRKNGEI